MTNRPLFAIQMREKVNAKQRLAVGAHLPRRQAEHLALLAVFFQTSKSTLIEKTVSEYLANAPSEQDAIDGISQIIQWAWDRRKKECSRALSWEETSEFAAFGKSIRGQLGKRGLPPSTIKKICDKVTR